MIHFLHPALLSTLLTIPLLLSLFFWADKKRVQALKNFGAKIKKHRRRREWISLSLAITLIIIALARPTWNAKTQTIIESSRDVIFLLDVSRSMLAPDLHPNRLEAAKTAILDCVDEMTHDRVALVLFAGSAEIRCPLTTDYDYFRMTLRQASVESVPVGGTYISIAIDKVVDRLIEPQKAGLTDLILISDGEDLEPSENTIKAIQKMDQAGGRLIAIGIGNTLHGKRIPTDKHHFMKHKNTEVWTRLHSAFLQKLAASTSDGIYFEVADRPFNLRQIYHQIMEHAQRNNQEKQLRKTNKEQFHIFLVLAALLLLWSQRRSKK